jgi:hypothetical protein
VFVPSIKAGGDHQFGTLENELRVLAYPRTGSHFFAYLLTVVNPGKRTFYRSGHTAAWTEDAVWLDELTKRETFNSNNSAARRFTSSSPLFKRNFRRQWRFNCESPWMSTRGAAPVQPLTCPSNGVSEKLEINLSRLCKYRPWQERFRNGPVLNAKRLQNSIPQNVIKSG